MSIAKVKNSSVLNGMKLEEGNDSLNTLVRQAIGTEPFLSFPRSADSSIQWFQFLNSLDNQGRIIFFYRIRGFSLGKYHVLLTCEINYMEEICHYLMKDII